MASVASYRWEEAWNQRIMTWISSRRASPPSSTLEKANGRGTVIKIERWDGVGKGEEEDVTWEGILGKIIVRMTMDTVDATVTVTIVETSVKMEVMMNMGIMMSMDITLTMEAMATHVMTTMRMLTTKINGTSCQSQTV